MVGLRARVERYWRMDLGDQVQRRILRARIVTAGALFSIPTTVTIVVINAASGVSPLRPSQWAVLPYLILTAWYFGRRGARAGDAALVANLTAGQALAAAALGDRMGSIDVAETAVLLLIAMAIGALFVESPRAALVQLLLQLGILVVACVVTDAQPAGLVQLAMSVPALSMVYAVLRIMRSRFLAAIAAAHRNAVTDVLTGLANRRGLELFAAEHWREWTAEGRDVLAAIIVDVDHFKVINDTRGHAAGDEVLRRLGKLLNENVRATDVAVRLGGEEFLLLMPMRSGEGAAAGERVRRAVEERLAPVTVSVGVHETPVGRDDAVTDRVWSAVDVADRALYAAKHGGRNRVVATAAA